MGTDLLELLAEIIEGLLHGLWYGALITTFIWQRLP